MLPQKKLPAAQVVIGSRSLGDRRSRVLKKDEFQQSLQLSLMSTPVLVTSTITSRRLASRNEAPKLHPS